jgi:pimeloyl-ACP methyl ester carboxylesterase
MIPSGDAGIQLFVRNKHPAGKETSTDKILLFVHGATYPAETAFDLPIEGVSMMDLIAARGYDVYLVDVRGYGRSTRPAEMSQPPAANKPIVSTKVAAHDLGASRRLHPQEAQGFKNQRHGLVVGHLDRRIVHQRAQ